MPKNPLKKILLILTLLIILPAALFMLYEIASLTQTEQVIEETYSRQLDAIIFSVNQYSETVVNNWRSGINKLAIENKLTGSNPELDSLLNSNQSMRSVVLIDSLNGKMVNLDSAKLSNFDPVQLKEILKKNEKEIKRLFTYERGGYYKIEPLGNPYEPNSVILVFILNDTERKNTLCAVYIDTRTFAQKILAPRIKGLTNGELIIGILKGDENIYSTASMNPSDVEQSNDLWILPGYQMAISLKGKTINEIVHERTITNLSLIAVVFVILIAGVWIVFKNIKREIELAQIKSDFVSNVSHELRTPLALISMFAETLEMGRVKSDQKRAEYYSIIKEETSRLSRIVNKILNFSQIEAGKRNYHFQKKNLNTIAKNVYSNYKFHLQNNGYQFSFNPKDDITETELDGEAVSEALINLIDNSMKYSKEKKQITVSTGQSDGYIYLQVEDKGIGISDSNQKRIFEKFFRVSTGDVHNVKGTGLGLTIVAHIVEAHKGKVELDSKEGEGSCFRLLFPLIKHN